jgi:hypothetical protein
MALPCESTILWGINPPFDGLSPCKGQVAYALLTRAPVSDIATLPLDLHVLSLPLAFILSQDQTLRCIENFKLYPRTSGFTYFLNPSKIPKSINPKIIYPDIPNFRNLVSLFYPFLNIFQ